MIRLQAQRAVVPGDRVLVPALEDEHLPQRQVAAYILRCQPDAPVQVRRGLLEVSQPQVDLGQHSQPLDVPGVKMVDLLADRLRPGHRARAQGTARFLKQRIELGSAHGQR